jgi:hypothetical protein
MTFSHQLRRVDWPVRVDLLSIHLKECAKEKKCVMGLEEGKRKNYIITNGCCAIKNRKMGRRSGLTVIFWWYVWWYF